MCPYLLVELVQAVGFNSVAVLVKVLLCDPLLSAARHQWNQHVIAARDSEGHRGQDLVARRTEKQTRALRGVYMGWW